MDEESLLLIVSNDPLLCLKDIQSFLEFLPVRIRQEWKLRFFYSFKVSAQDELGSHLAEGSTSQNF